MASATMQLGRRLAATLAPLLLLACQTPAPPLPEADIPAGRTLVRDGLAAGGTALVALDDEPARCRAPEFWRLEAGAWREQGRGEPLDAASCPAVSARLAPDGRTLAIYDYGAGTATLLSLAGGRPAATGRAGFPGSPGYGSPPPGPNLAFAARTGRLLLGGVNRDCRTLPEGRVVCGVALLLERRGGRWEELARLRPPADEDGQVRFGQAVALGPDGGLALAGGTGEPGRSGALWLFALAESGPQVLQKLVPSRHDAWFANDVALAGDGSWLAVGGEQAVYLFERVSEGFAFRKRLGPPDLDAGHFGETVAISADGARLAVGAPRSTCAEGERCGVVYIYDRDRTFWDLARTLRPATNRVDANFGHHLALSPDGSHLAAQGVVLHVFTLERAGPG
jgi:hypothetical protein